MPFDWKGENMDQKEIVQKATTDSVMTVNKLLVFLSRLSGEGLVEWFQKMTPLEGEVDVYKFLSRNPYAKAIPLDEKVDLEHFKEVFKEYNITFAFKQVENGTELYVRSQDRKVTELACQRIFKDILTKKIDIKKYVLKRNSQTFKEKVEMTYRKLDKTSLSNKKIEIGKSIKGKGR